MPGSPTSLDRPELLRPLLEHWADADDDRGEQLVARCSEVAGEPPGTVLDLGCGVGRHVVPLAERGIETHGLDAVPAFLDRARERAAAAGVSERTTFVERDMRDLADHPETYDAICNVWSFGYFDDATNEALLAACRDRLISGGVLLLRIANREGMLDGFDDDDDVLDAGEYTYVRRHEYDPLDARVRTRTVVLDDETYLGEYTYGKRLYAPVEIRRLLAENGFEEVRLFGSLSGGELRRDSGEMVVVARA